MSLNKEVFDEAVAWIRENFPKLKLRVFKDTFTPGRVTGEYMDNSLHIATGPCIQTGDYDWKWTISTLAHEFSHFLREGRHSEQYNERVYEANAQLYTKGTKDSIRKSAVYWVLRDEYYTECETFEQILPDWGIVHEFQDYYYWTNHYNYKIKYLYETGILLTDRVGYITAPNRRFTDKEIHAPLTASKKRQIDKLLADKYVLPVYTNYDDKVDINDTI